MKLANARCWCNRADISIPVQLLLEGNTESCAYPGCGPGCETVPDTDAFDDPYDEDHQPTRRRWKMNKYNPAKYDPRVDSSPGCTPREDAVVLIVADGACGCGCTEPTSGPKVRFKMGHDARLKGILSRALSADVPIHVLDPDSQQVDIVTALEYAARFSTAKVDWPDRIRASAALVARNNSKTANERLVLEHAAQRGAVSVGRSDKTGSVAAIYELEDGRREVEFVDGDGAIRKEAV